MFRRTTTGKRDRALGVRGVQFRDGRGVTTQAERSAQRLDAARTDAARLLHM